MSEKFCEECFYFRGNGKNCIDDITVGFSDMPHQCGGFKREEAEQ